MAELVAEKPKIMKHDPAVLDLAFAMDCTGSMGSYIHNAQQNIRNIVETIVASEKSDVRMALVEYRDHPPQDNSFVTRVNDFTASISKMKTWLNNCSANGGGDGPEAVADALFQVLKVLQWRPNATKICVLISDAPPHGLDPRGDGFPDGCPAGHDPAAVVDGMAEKGIVLYCVGCEPSIAHYRHFFMGLAHKTGGQYVPLSNAALLAKVIIGGAQEEISLQRIFDDVERDVMTEVTAMRAAGAAVDEDEISRKIHTKFSKQGVTSQLQVNNCTLDLAEEAKAYSAYTNISDARKEFERKAGPMAPMQPFFKRHRVAAKPRAVITADPACEDLLGGDYPPPPPILESAVQLFTFGSAAPPPAPGSAAPPSYDSSSVDVVQGAMNLQQAQRMVRKAVAKNTAK